MITSLNNLKTVSYKTLPAIYRKIKSGKIYFDENGKNIKQKELGSNSVNEYKIQVIPSVSSNTKRYI